MKGNCIVGLLLSTALVLTACKAEQQPVSTTAATAAVSEQTVPATETQSPVEKRQLFCYVENHETTVDASLFSGAGYSIYIIDDNWNHQAELVDGHSVDIWQNAAYQDAALWVVKMDGADLSAAQTWTKQTFEGYDLFEDKQGGMLGNNADGDFMGAKILSTDSAAYILIEMYALEDSETLGIYLRVMTDTFEAN